MNKAMSFIHEQLNPNTTKQFPKFKAGDNISVNYKIVEGGKERIQAFKGDVIKRQGDAYTQSFTVRKISNSVGVERTFPLYSPNIESVIVHKIGKVNRARIFYMRGLSGKKARIDEKIILQNTDEKKSATKTEKKA